MCCIPYRPRDCAEKEARYFQARVSGAKHRAPTSSGATSTGSALSEGPWGPVTAPETEPQREQRTVEDAGPSDVDFVPCCRACGSDRLATEPPTERCPETGYADDEGVRCLDCGAVEDAPDFVEQPAVALIEEAEDLWGEYPGDVKC